MEMDDISRLPHQRCQPIPQALQQLLLFLTRHHILNLTQIKLPLPYEWPKQLTKRLLHKREVSFVRRNLLEFEFEAGGQGVDCDGL